MTVVWLDTPVVVTVNVAVVDPDDTVTLAGVVAEVLLSESVTTMPPLGAGPLKVTVPVELVPPRTVVGFMATEDRLTATADVKFSPVTLALFTVVDWLAGEKVNPVRVGVTV